MKLSKYLKRVRKQANMTQEEFARHLGISRTAYCQIETGKRTPMIKTISAISKYCGANTKEIYEMLEENKIE